MFTAVVMLVNTGCDITVVANHATEVVTEPATEAKKNYCKVQIQSYDKQSLTDNVTYTIKKLDITGDAEIIEENLKTFRGLVEVNIEAGKYEISSSSGVYNETIVIDEDETSFVISAENNPMYSILDSTKKICFIGDSITKGTVTDGEGWYSGLLAKFPNIKQVDVAALGGQTSASLFDDQENMNIIKESKATTYVIALGVNDVIYRYKNDRATTYTANEYLQNMKKLVRFINEKNNNTNYDFIFIAPFEHTNKYSYTLPKYIQRDNTHREYTCALYNWCNIRGYTFVAPMNYIKNTLATVEDSSEYMKDDVHPLYPLGTVLYSEGVYESSVLNTIGTLKINQNFYREEERQRTASKYKTYPIDYIQTDVDTNVMKDTFFTITDQSTGMYLSLKKDGTEGEYKFDQLSSDPHYYHSVNSDGTFIINDIPQGGYTINFEYNKQGYSSYLECQTVFVNGGIIQTNATLYMKDKIDG